MILAPARLAPLGTARPFWVVNLGRREGSRSELVKGRECIPWKWGRDLPSPGVRPLLWGPGTGELERVLLLRLGLSTSEGMGLPMSPRGDQKGGQPGCERRWALDFTSRKVYRWYAAGGRAADRSVPAALCPYLPGQFLSLALPFLSQAGPYLLSSLVHFLLPASCSPHTWSRFQVC